MVGAHPENGLQPIGWREWVALPELNVAAIKAKIDTGARISALHSSDIEPFELHGRRMVHFNVYPKQRNDVVQVRVQAPVIGQRVVRSSSGHEELRWVVQSLVRFRDREWPIELSLATRDAMGFRLLLGRNALADRFFVHPGASYLGGKPPRKRSRPSPPIEEPS